MIENQQPTGGRAFGSTSLEQLYASAIVEEERSVMKVLIGVPDKILRHLV